MGLAMIVAAKIGALALAVGNEEVGTRQPVATAIETAAAARKTRAADANAAAAVSDMREPATAGTWTGDLEMVTEETIGDDDPRTGR